MRWLIFFPPGYHEDSGVLDLIFEIDMIHEPVAVLLEDSVV